MSSRGSTRRTSKFDREQRDGRQKPTNGRLPNNSNCIFETQKQRFFRWLHTGR